ncbi:MAG TPA: UDP-N-acetylglucosamine 1-carboxyvinyltransferase [Pirellulales bacterium]|jgi:UDP-N-acetylglucosamine 1-carboxyvinyltransferase
MDVITLQGGRPLRGTVCASGSKNATLPIMAATILASESVVLERAPNVADVDTLAFMLGHLGVEVKRHANRSLHLSTVDASPERADFDLVGRMRASFCLLGPLLARRGRAVVALPGGCNLGPRPIDLHLNGLAALGANIRIVDNYVIAEAKSLHGVEMDLSGLRGPTVTGTANILMAAVLARGETTIRNAAREPEVVDLGEFLISLGARIEGLGTSTLHIRGVDELGGGRFEIIPDRIETGTLLLAGAVTSGDVIVDNCRPDHLDAALAVLDDAGVSVDSGTSATSGRHWIRAAGPWQPLSFHFSALPYPGVPTDLQAQFTALAAIADGQSTIADFVFPQRFAHLDQFQRMGAQISLDRSTAAIDGVDRLRGAEVTATDLRAGAALVLAGLSAQGQTTISQPHHLARGYECLTEKLRSLGADIEISSAADSQPEQSDFAAAAA